MPKRTPTTGEKNLIGKRLIELRRATPYVTETFSLQTPIARI